MDYQFTLRRFFTLVFLFVVCPIVAWVIYAKRTNAPANMYENQEGGYSSNNVSIPDDKLDMTTPFYQNEAGEKLEKEQGRPTESNPEEKWSASKHSKIEAKSSSETPAHQTEPSKKESK